MNLRAGLSLAVAVCMLLVTGRAFAWHEAHLVGDEAHVRVDTRGMATVEHILKWRIVHGPLKSIDLAGVDLEAVLEPTASVRTDDGHDLAAVVVRGEDSVVHVVVDSTHGVSRGVVTFDVRWQLDLVATHAIIPDGASWRLSWSLPVAVNGFDLPRIVLDLPAAPEPPRSLGGDLSAPEQGGGETDTLRRDGDRDILEIIRPYAAHGESLAGSIHLDPRALPEVQDPSLRPVAPPTISAEPQRWQSGAYFAALGALGAAFALLAARRERAFAAACAVEPRSILGLIPLSGVLRTAAAGLTLAVGVAVQGAGQPIGGSLLIAACVLCSAVRGVRGAPVARGPGRWFPVRPEDAFRISRARWFRKVPWRSALGALSLVGAAWASARLGPQGPWMVLIDCAPLMALLATGRRLQRRSVDLEIAGKLLHKPFSRLKEVRSLRAVPWGRVGLDGKIDELRIRVLPQVPVPGVVGIEMGHAWSRTSVGWAPAPEVMVRVLEGSAAAAKIGQSMPDARQAPGRRSQERVLRLTPEAPTDSACLGLVRRAAEILTDRRAGSGIERQEGTERRKPIVALPVAARGRGQDWGTSIGDATC
jgi:hypothetical protein